MLFKSLTALGLATTVLADAATIIASLNTVITANAALNNSVANWNGNIVDAAPIASNFEAILSDINDAADVAADSDDLTTNEASKVYNVASSLVSDVKITLINIEAVEPKTEVVLTTSLFHLNLKQAKAAADNLGENLIAISPSSYVDQGYDLLAQLDRSFEAAIAVYAQ